MDETITSHNDIPQLPDGSRNCNPEGISFFKLIKEDFQTHERRFTQGFFVLVLHRFGNWRMGIKTKILRLPFTIIYKLAFPFTEIFCGIKLSYNVKVGRRVKIEHFGGMILGAREIGNDVTIRQNTTFGLSKKTELNGKPIIKNDVDIGCGVVILGHVVIGEHSVIGANAVVVKDVPPYSLVVGVPGRVVRNLRDTS
ncbi:MAG: serine acetyltransferase [Methylophaga sp.]|uniref:serine O-acetyltransferase n=1 Tax=Methylophaga sp. TaxID=2024840 RepID=UPI000C0E240C|nr:serine acetyltransferase [Methylophaga sp.]MBL1457683.1 serine acetyltransferase [Methylophaga sp.]